MCVSRARGALVHGLTGLENSIASTTHNLAHKGAIRSGCSTVVGDDCFPLGRLDSTGPAFRFAAAGKAPMSDPGPLFHQAAAALTRYFIADQTLGDTLHQIAELTI